MNQETMNKIFDDEEYQQFINKIDYSGVCNMLKKNQGITLKEISKILNVKEKYFECLMNVWTNNWNTFYHNGGRLVNENGKYYMLSPRNPQSRARNPKINLL
tara:strand:+ start:392 stop:697 length:306 start_codon:yes stop_codon:yes gene_type:complete